MPKKAAKTDKRKRKRRKPLGKEMAAAKALAAKVKRDGYAEMAAKAAADEYPVAAKGRAMLEMIRDVGDREAVLAAMLMEMFKKQIIVSLRGLLGSKDLKLQARGLREFRGLRAELAVTRDGELSMLERVIEGHAGEESARLTAEAQKRKDAGGPQCAEDLNDLVEDD